MQSRSIAVSLFEPALLVKEFMRKHNRFVSEDFQRDGNLLLRTQDYPTQTYMQWICRSILQDHHPSVEQADDLLVRDGMLPQAAQECSRLVFEQCVDILATLLPEVPFTEHSTIQFHMPNEFDLIVTI